MIADLLPKYCEAQDSPLTYETVRSMLIDGHEVAWMKYTGEVIYDIRQQGREGQPFEGHELFCECDFKFTLQDGKVLRTLDRHDCPYKQAAIRLRELELRAEYDQKSGGRIRGGALGTSPDEEDTPGEYTLNILRRHLEGEWMASNGSLLYLQTVGGILNLPEPAMWKLIDKLEAEHKLNRNQAVLFAYQPHPEYGGDPSDHYGTVEEDDLRIVAYGPKSQYERQEWLIKVFRGDQELKTISAPLCYEPRFGYDVEDVHTLELKTQELLDELKAAS